MMRPVCALDVQCCDMLRMQRVLEDKESRRFRMPDQRRNRFVSPVGGEPFHRSLELLLPGNILYV